MSSIALVTVIYPASLPFLPALINSVNAQTNKQFDFILVNDGIADITAIENRIMLPYRIISASGTPLAIRTSILEQLRREGFQKALFVDADDMLPQNWVSVLTAQLEDYEFVCCDLHLINASGKSISPAYWQVRLGQDFAFDQNFLLDKNILGFGNCGMQLTNDLILQMPEVPLPAPDWFFFFTNLQHKKALFSTQTCIYYRQHEGNMLGISSMSLERLQQITEKKIAHYQYLQQLGYSTTSYSQPLLALKENLRIPTPALEDKINYLIHQEIHYFWWEETNYLL